MPNPMTLLNLTVGIIVITLTACTAGPSRTNPSASDQYNQVPQWAVAISEPVDLIPIEETLENSPAITPSTFASNAPGTPRGLPQNMTEPISTRSTKNTRTTTDESQRNPSSNNGHRVVVNINQVNDTNEQAADQSTESAEQWAQLERLYQGDFDRETNRKLVQFGYDYFNRASKPDIDAPVPADYRIGPGDEILITVSGSFHAYHNLEVDRDGTIVIPDVGPVPVADLRYEELKQTIDRAFEQTRKGYELTISLGKIRTIRVHVVGEVAQPGMVEVSARSTVLDVLAAAGGPTKNGTLRKIIWRRDQAPEQVIDLYDFLLGGTEPPSEVVLPRDVIHVPSIGKTIGIAGYVQRPGIYEILESPQLEQAINMAGGLTPFSFKPHIQIERTIEGRGRETLDVALNEEGKQRTIDDGELLMIGAVDDRLQPVVQIAGEVVRPGNFQYRPGLRVSDLINLADGLTIEAFLPQAFISRQVGTPGNIEMVTDRVELGSTRRVIVIDLAKALQNDSEHNIELFPLDQLSIRSQQRATVQPTVEIIGAVQKPGRYELTTGLRVSELIALADNVTPDVYYDEAELIRRVNDHTNGQLNVKRYRFNLRRALEESGKHDPVLKNGDRLVIRKIRQAEVKARIEGLVRFPGEYVFPANAKITDLIAAAGGLVDDADLRAAVFTRQSVKDLQNARFAHLRERTQRVFENALRDMVQSGQPREGLAAKLALQDTEQLVDRMQRNESTGRVVIPFTSQDFPTSPYNLSLESGDQLYIPRKQETVAVIGCVFTPNSFVATDNLTVREALDRVGGTTDMADDHQVYIIRADGNVESLVQKGSQRLKLSAVLLPGDVVLVPREAPSRTFGAQLSDTLVLLRQAAELGLISTQIGEPVSDFNFSSISDTGRFNSGINAYQEAILDETRR